MVPRAADQDRFEGVIVKLRMAMNRKHQLTGADLHELLYEKSPEERNEIWDDLRKMKAHDLFQRDGHRCLSPYDKGIRGSALSPLSQAPVRSLGQQPLPPSP
jgi:hypothetical protein